LDGLEVTLKVTNREDLSLKLVSNVLPVSSAFLDIHKKTHEFAPVALGAEAPTQFYTLLNTGDAEVYFALILTDLESVSSKNFNFPIFECGVTSGIIPALGSMVLPWRFHPLEAKSYSTTITVVYQRGADFVSEEIVFTGTGFNSEQSASSKPQSDPISLYLKKDDQIPRVPSITYPSQLVRLSSDGINFGQINLFSVTRQILFLTNISKDQTVSFQWNLHPLSQVLKITPSEGQIEPGQTKVCKVAFTASDGPNVYNFNVFCEVTNQTELRSFEQNMKKTAVIREQRQNEFTLTDAGRTGNNRTGAFPIAGNTDNLRGTILPVGTFVDVDRNPGPRPILAKFMSKYNADHPHDASLTHDPKLFVPVETLLLDSQLRSKKYVV
jgi:hypothetical protein